MDIKPTSYRYDGEGIECAYRNEKWVVCIKNWKPNIVEKDTKMMYVQDAGCSMDNSEYCKLSQEEISYIQKLARPMLAE